MSEKPDKKKTSDFTAQALALADRLHKWSTENNLTGDPIVKRLRHDLESGANIALWNKIDLLEYLPFPSTKSVDKNVRRNSIATLIRNILVFVPVALTWLAVSKSTSAFSAYININKSSVVNFLEFWQNGYGFLNKEWTIGHIAFIDALIIALVITLTLYGSVTTRRLEKQRHILRKRHFVDRDALALDLTLFIAEQEVLTTASFNGATNATLRAMSDAGKGINLASKNVEKLLKQFTTSETKAIKNFFAAQEKLDKQNLSHQRSVRKEFSLDNLDRTVRNIKSKKSE